MIRPECRRSYRHQQRAHETFGHVQVPGNAQPLSSELGIALASIIDSLCSETALHSRSLY